MLVELNDWLYSTTRLDLVMAELQDYANWFGHQEIRGRVGVETQLDGGPKLSTASLGLLVEIQKAGSITSATFDELIQSLRQIRETAPSITLVLAAIAPEPVKQKLVSWIRREIHPQALINFQCNSALMGGLVVRLGSHVYDWSFRKQILDHKDQFRKALERV